MPSTDIVHKNELSLKELTRAVRLSEGQFSLIFAHCNYISTRERIVERIRTEPSIAVAEIHLPPSALTLYTAILDKFTRKAPDFKSWAGSPICFEPTADDLFVSLETFEDKIFREMSEPDAAPNPLELSTFLESVSGDLDRMKPEADAETRFRLEAPRGWAAFDREDWDEAMAHFEAALHFYEQSADAARLAALLDALGVCLEKKEDLESAKTRFQECAALPGEAVPIKYTRDLCRILRKLEDWDALTDLAESSLQIDYLALARARINRDDPETLEHLESARDNGPSDDDPELFIEILEWLRGLYFDQGEFLRAFNVKLEKHEVAHEFGFRAFIGAGRLRARRRSAAGDATLEIEASGRRDDVRELVNRLKEERRKLLVLHGPSGVGKSSLLEAGVEPALENEIMAGRAMAPVLVRTYKE